MKGDMLNTFTKQVIDCNGDETKWLDDIADKTTCCTYSEKNATSTVKAIILWQNNPYLRCEKAYDIGVMCMCDTEEMCKLTCVYRVNHQCIDDRISSSKTMSMGHSETMVVQYFFQPVLLHSNEMQSDRAIRISAITSPASEMQSMYWNGPVSTQDTVAHWSIDILITLKRVQKKQPKQTYDQI